MRTKIYLKDPEKHKDIDTIEKKERIYCIRTSEDDKGIFFVLDGKLDKKKAKGYSGIREIEYVR